MKTPASQHAKRQGAKQPDPTTKKTPEKVGELFLDKRMNWWLGMALVLSVFTSQNAMEPIGAPRVLWLSVFLLAFVVYFLGLQTRQWKISRPRPLTLILGSLAAGFLLILAATSFTAINKQEALYWTVRFALTLSATVLFTATFIREEEKLQRLCQGLAVVLIVQSLVGILQFYGLAFTELPPAGSATPYGMMANRNLFASALVLLFPFCGYLAYAGNLKWKVISGAALWLGVFGIIIGQTRSAWVSLAAGLLLSNIFVFALRNRFGPSLVKGWCKGMVLFFIGTILAVLISIALDKDKQLTGSLKERAVSLARPAQGVAKDESTRGRLIFLRECLEMMRDHPIFGVGAGNWKLAAPQYGSEGLPNADGIVTRDRAHNVYFQTGAETGIAGFLVYLGIWVTVALIAFKVILKSDRNERRMLGVASLAGICIYAVDSLFSFPNESVAHGLFLAFTLGSVVGVYEKLPLQASPALMPYSLKKAYLFVPVVFLAFSAYLGYAKENFEYRIKRANAYKKLNQHELILAEVAAGRSALASIDPLGDPLEFYSTHAYTGLGQLDNALKAIERAHELNPWSVRIWNEMGIVYVNMNRLDDAIRCYKEALRMAPRFDVALKNLGSAYHTKGMLKESTTTLIKSQYQGDEYLVKLIGSNYRALAEYDKAAEVLRQGVRQFPNSGDLLENLANLEYVQLNDATNAAQHFQQLLALRPNHPKRDEYRKIIDALPQPAVKPGAPK